MRRAGREEWRRVASLVLVAVIATFSLPLGASTLTRAADTPPARRAHVKHLHVEARPVTTNRRPVVERPATLPTTTLVVAAALTVIGLLAWARARRSSWEPALLPGQRAPPSLR
jgi:hypothetical protein